MCFWASGSTGRNFKVASADRRRFARANIHLVSNRKLIFPESDDAPTRQGRVGSDESALLAIAHKLQGYTDRSEADFMSNVCLSADGVGECMRSSLEVCLLLYELVEDVLESALLILESLGSEGYLEEFLEGLVAERRDLAVDFSPERRLHGDEEVVVALEEDVSGDSELGGVEDILSEGMDIFRREGLSGLRALGRGCALLVLPVDQASAVELIHTLLATFVSNVRYKFSKQVLDVVGVVGELLGRDVELLLLCRGTAQRARTPGTRSGSILS